MARKVRLTQDDGDDAPEVVSRSVSKADAKRQEKALREFEAEEKARRKARNRERDQKLKERARVTKGGKSGEKRKKVRFAEVEEAGDESVDEKDDVEARMLRAMRDAADEVGGGEGEADDDDSDGDFMRFGQGMDLGDDIASGSDSSQDEDDEDAKMLMGEDDSIDLEALADDEAMDEDEEDDETTPLQSNIHRSNKRADYLADDIFAAAFASQNSKSTPKKSVQSTQQQTKKRRRKSTARPKDLVVGYVMYFPDPIREALSPGSVVVPSARYLNSRIHGHKPLHGVSHLHVLADSWTIASLSEASKPCSRPRKKVGSGGRVNPPCFYPTHAA